MVFDLEKETEKTDVLFHIAHVFCIKNQVSITELTRKGSHNKFAMTAQTGTVNRTRTCTPTQWNQESECFSSCYFK